MGFNNGYYLFIGGIFGRVDGERVTIVIWEFSNFNVVFRIR